MPKLILLFFSTIIYSSICKAQELAVHNINKDNGLSTNHVYTTLVDHRGYLWIGTTDGLYRYNGYTLERYDYSDGLPNTDIWSLHEDKTGRIWPLTIATDIGYIKNNIFKKLYKKGSSDALSEIYPGRFAEFEDKILFHNGGSYDKAFQEIAVIKGDTITSRRLYNHSSTHKNLSPYVIFSNFSAKLRDSSISIYNNNKILNSNNGKPVPDRVIKTGIDIQLALVINPLSDPFADKYIFYYPIMGDYINFVNVNNGERRSIAIKEIVKDDDEKILFCYAKGHVFYGITKNNIIILDRNLNLVSVKKPARIFKDDRITGTSNTYFQYDKFWGNILSTNDRGVFLDYSSNSRFRKSSIPLEEHTYVGSDKNTGYWWKNNSRTLTTVANGMIISQKHLPELFQLQQIVPYNDEKLILMCRHGLHWFYYKTGKTDLMMERMERAIYNDEKITLERNTPFLFVNSTIDLVVQAENKVFLNSSTNGFNSCSWNDSTKQLNINTIELKRYKNIAYNTAQIPIVIYNYNKALIYWTTTGRKTYITTKNFEELGLRGVEKIVIDKYGSIIVKDYNSIRIYNVQRQRILRYFRNYNLEKACISLNDNILTVVGSFGVISCKIMPDGTITNSRTYPNVKGLLYNHVSDVQSIDNIIVLKTDKGIYNVDIHNGPAIAVKDEYRVVANYNSELYSINGSDTLNIHPQSAVMNIDLIKPTGTGKLTMSYSVNGGRYSSTSDQVVIPALEPGSYNTLSIIFADDSWTSKPFVFTIYAIPEWWQTKAAKKLIFAGIILLLIGLIYVVVIVTRRIVNNNNNRKNQRRELELKSIYSQINPHFIFNSLSTAQYFVRKNRNKEAYEHINQFSDLLRSYIKSSRDKYISIAEELSNLENYLQLQLTRFEDKFEYKFILDPDVDPKTIRIPSLLLQPLVENALNHGIFHSDKKGLLLISFGLDKQDNLICKVDDNGIGRQRSKELRSEIIRKADSYGNILIKELIDTFNKYETIKIELDYIDKTPPETGTIVIIKIKNYTHV